MANDRGKFESLACVDGLPGLAGKLEFEERHRAEYLSRYWNAEDLARTLVERERQLAQAIAAIERQKNGKT